MSVTLTATPSPTSGQPGVTTITLTGSNFPTGTISPAAVTVSLTPAAGGTPVTTPASTVTTVVLSTRRVTFTIPASISVATPAPYNVSLSGTTASTPPIAFVSGNNAVLTINPGPQILSITPNTGAPGQSLTVNILGASTNFVQGSTQANFGAGIAVGGGAQAALGPVTVYSPTSTGAQLVIASNATLGARNVTVTTGTQTVTLANGFTVAAAAPTITSFSPSNGPTGTIVTINGTNLSGTPQVSMPNLNGGTISVPLQSMSATSLSVVIPSGATTGPLTVSNNGANAVTNSSFTVNPSSTFTLTAAPANANLIVGQSVSYAVQLNSANGFNQLAPLSVSGLPSGINASFKPSSITSGQTAILTLTAPANQPISTATLNISATASVAGIPVSQTANAALAITGPTTSFLGRTVAADSLETPLAGVVVTMLGLNGGGGQTGCTGSTVSDAAGNFALTGLPSQCIGPQLIGYNGANVTSPAGNYAGVNLIYTLVSGQVVVSPVLVHLPKLNNAETMMVQQNSTVDQTFKYATIPGVTVTVYAGTTLKLADGSSPNPFPLQAVSLPIDRLPEEMPVTNAGVMAFIVAFQPANSVASQAVAVSYPNTLNNAPGTGVPLMTLNPTLGRMVPYGTGTVSADGTKIVPDIDPSTGPLQHRYGIVNFDWHGWLAALINSLNPCPECGPIIADPVDISSGLQELSATDLSISGTLGSISIQRVYRTLTANVGTFGMGDFLQYDWQLNTGTPNSASAINLIRPDGNQLPFSRQTTGTLTNSTMPSLQGASMTTNANGITTLRFKDGTLYTFQAFGSLSALISIADRNGNAITLTQTPIASSILRITKITDAVGRSINLTYDSGGHALTATDPTGRTVTYTYNPTGTLATITDPMGGVTRYSYDSQNRMNSMTDPRGIVMFQDTFDSNGRVAQQTRPDGGVFKFSYTLSNTLIGASPVILTTMTDPLGNVTSYRFNQQGLMTDFIDAIGQIKSLARSQGTNLITQISGPAQCAVCGPSGQGTVSYTYDGFGNTLTATDALGATTSYTYDPVFSQVTSITDTLGNSNTYTYDSHGHLVSATDANGHTNTFMYGPSGLLLTAADPLNNVTKVAYDQFGNPITVTDALGNTSTNIFDSISRPIQSVDALGKRTSVTYDLLGRVTSIQDGRRSTTQFGYDAVGDLLTLTDPRGSVTTYSYDSLARVKTRQAPTGKSESYQYDLNGNLVEFTDRRGQMSQFRFDQLNRLINESYQDGATVTRSYDPYSRLIAVSDSIGGSFTFGYDANGRLLFQGEPNGTVTYTRDALGRTITRQVSGQNTVTYSYDHVGGMLSASMPGASVGFTYDQRGLPSTESRGNGVSSGFSFDPLGRVLSLTHAKGPTPINSQTYAYNASGNRTSATNDLSQPLVTQAAVATVDQANELVSFGGTTYTNDANGNRLAETNAGGTITYAWDGRNRLTSITDASGNKTSFKYDFTRNLMEIDKTAAGAIAAQKFVVDNVANVVSLTDASGLPVSILTGRATDSHYASVDSSGNVSYGIADTTNSTLAVTNASGSILSEQKYEPFGATTGNASVAYPFAFTGRVPVSGSIYYFRARFYDALTGRFISEDPRGLASGGTNFGMYANNNPIQFNDPSGTIPFCDFVEGTAIASASGAAVAWLNGAGSSAAAAAAEEYGSAAVARLAYAALLASGDYGAAAPWVLLAAEASPIIAPVIAAAVAAAVVYAAWEYAPAVAQAVSQGLASAASAFSNFVNSLSTGPPAPSWDMAETQTGYGRG